MLVTGNFLETYDAEVLRLVQQGEVPNPPVVATGVQGKTVCWHGKMFNLDDERLAGVRDAIGSRCLTASVLLVDVQRWISQGITESVESLLKSNYEKPMWYLGSMPPLILALRGRWVQWERVVDMKGLRWAERPHRTDLGPRVYHPVKDDGGLINDPRKLE